MKFGKFIHENQIVVVAVILFLAVLVYCMFHRYDAARYNEAVVIVDHLRGRCLTPYGEEVHRPNVKR